MKLGLSNLAYSEFPTDADVERLAQLGFSGIEVAPTRIASWMDLTEERVEAFRKTLAGVGFSVPSLQAIFFGIDDVQLLGDNASFERMMAHMHVVGRIGQQLGAGIAVFGAPRQRGRGNLTEDVAFELGRDRFSRLAEISHQYGVTIGLEPVPPSYGCDFLHTWQLVKSMVNAVSLPGLGVHLDTSCVQLGGGDISEAVEQCAEQLVHFHAAEPELRDFGAPVAPHQPAAAALCASGYEKWVVIEMLEAKAKGENFLLVAAEYVAATYANRTSF